MVSPPATTSTSGQTDNTFGVGAIIAVVLGIILLVQFVACTVALVVCSMCKQRRTEGEGIGKY